ncbi:MAG TPA: protein kinase, partial [Solirubrobacteraceae bacterium]|nr:protein kinase [Solirubrobacteraceae bacterium]
MGLLAPGTIVGGCRIEGVVGKGGMGVVYLARQLELERDVALKVISPDLTEDALARGRFLAEARAAAAVEHPNVVPVHAVGTDGDRAYLVMRFGADALWAVAGGDTITRIDPKTEQPQTRELASRPGEIGVT